MTPPPSPYWSKHRHADRTPFLAARVAILRAVRAWFEAQGFIETEPNMLVASPGAETHIDAFAVDGRYLHTSPEFAMKKLLAAGETKIFSLGKVWRKGEHGPLHASEFTMLEWYRAGAPYTQVMDDCIELARIAARATHGALKWKGKSCDPFADAEVLTVKAAFAQYYEPPSPSPALPEPSTNTLPPGAASASDEFSKAIIQIEPHLGAPALTLLTEYPISEAALAQRTPHDPTVAERFELYACGVELANGFGELTDPVEQRARLIEAMSEKQKRYDQTWPIDEDFLAALAHMPPASGCALGFDRLVMLASHARHINDVLWTPQ